jgi:hypothetical protein
MLNQLAKKSSLKVSICEKALSFTKISAKIPFTASLVDALKAFSKKPVQQLTVVEKHRILISLSGTSFLV